MRDKPSFTDYLSILYKWKRFIVINFFIAALISIVIAFIIPVKYKSTATVMIPPSKEIGLGGLTNLLSSGTSALGMGAKLLGVTNANEDLLLGFLNSKAVLKKVIKEYNLFEYYDIEKNEFDRLLETFKDDLMFDPNEFGMIDISVINKDPKLCAEMANYFVEITDSINIYFNIEQARRYRAFIEKKFLDIQKNIKIAEKNYYNFQKEFGAFDIPEQIKALVETSSIIEGQIIQQEVILASIGEKLGMYSPQYKEQKIQMNEMKKQLKKLYEGKTQEDFFISLKDIPELQLKYIRLYREMEIQNKMLEFIYPIYEQARLDEQKSMPTLIIVDRAVPPQLKYSPKRSFIVIGITFIVFILLLIIIFRSERVFSLKDNLNLIETKEYKIYDKIMKFYKI